MTRNRENHIAKNPKLPIPLGTLSDQVQKMFDSLNDEHPFPCAIVSTAYLEQYLASILHAFFIESSIADGICDHEQGILKDLSSRAKIAYCVGLISKGMFHNGEAFGRSAISLNHRKFGANSDRFPADDIFRFCHMYFMVANGAVQ